VRTAILVLWVSLVAASACAPAAALTPDPSVPDHRGLSAVATAAEGELTLEIAELI